MRMNNMRRNRIIARIEKVHLSAIAVGAMKQNAGSAQARPSTRREKMKTMLLAAAAALSLGVGSAYADSEGAPTAGVVAQAAGHSVPSTVSAQNGQPARAYVTRSQNQGTWLFAP